MYLQGQKLVEIASQLNLPEGTVRRWKCTHKWENERSDKKSERSPKRKRGAQPGNKNSSGGPPGNKKAEKYGFFSKYLPEETREIFSAIDQADPLDLLWHQIQLAYAAIIRAQRIAYVKDQQDKTIEKIEEKEGNVIRSGKVDCGVIFFVCDLHRTFSNIKPVLWNLKPVDTSEHFLVDCLPKLVMMLAKNHR